MAPKKPKKPSYLQRQRQLRAQQQQVRQASSNKLPPGKKGGDLTKANPAKPTATSKPAPVQRVRVRDLGSTKPNQMSGNTPRALPPGRTGGALARTARGAANVASTGAGMAGRVAGAFGTALAIPAAIKNIKDVAERNRRWNEYKERMGMNQKPSSNEPRSNTRGQRAKPPTVSIPKLPTRDRQGRRTATATTKPQGQSWRDRVGSSNVDNLRQGQNDTIRSYNNKPTPDRPSASRPSQSTPSRSAASGSGSQRSSAPQTTKPALPGRKWEDFNPGRGTSKSNNPLLDRDSGGMKLRDRMKQREDAQRSESLNNLKNNFGQDSGYETKTKVDGSKYADKKPDMKKVNEYNRRKRRYYD